MSRADSRSSRSSKAAGRGAPRKSADTGAGAAGRRPGAGLGAAGRSTQRREAPARESAGAYAGPNYIYGRNPVREALRGRRAVTRLLLVAGPVGDELQEALDEWTSGVRESGAQPQGRAQPVVRPRPPLLRLAAQELAALVGSGDHQGIGAEVAAYPYVDAEQILRSHTLLIALDEVQDPHNLGAVIRTAAAAGAGVIIPRHRAAEITGAVVKASAGATERASVAMVRNLADFLAQAKEAGFWIYGASGRAENSYTAQDYTYPTCFVLGSEGEGLGRRVESMCDVMVSIPLGAGVESLNVSVSAGILLYEVVRQRAAAAHAADRGAAGAAGGAATRRGPEAAPKGQAQP